MTSVAGCPRLLALLTRGSLAAALLALALGAPPASAAPAAAQEPQLAFRGGGGVAFPVGAAGDRFKPGWQLTAGASWRFDERLALQLDYSYGRHKAIGQSLQAGFVQGRHVLQHLDLDLRVTVNPGGPALFYLLAGPSLVRREAEIVDVTGYEPGPAVCDPWLMVCEPKGAPLRDIAGARSETGVGFNAGAGIEIRLAGDARFFVESLWLLARGREYGLPSGPSRGSGAAYLPLTFGLRF